MLEELFLECKACTACHLRNEAATQVVPWQGGAQARIMFISEAPGRKEDETGIPFQGSAGGIFDSLVASLGFARGKDTHVTNVVKCRPPNNRTPTKKECELCAGLFLEREIEIVQPQAIICFGKVSSEYILNAPGSGLGNLRGQVYKRGGITVGVTYHPAYLLYNRTRQAALKWTMWEDITSVLESSGIEYRRQQRGSSGG